MPSNTVLLGDESLVQHGEYLPLFNRQRRNLMVASVLLFFAKYSEVVFVGPLFGFKGKIDVGATLVFFLGYFFLRYFQFFSDMGDKYIKSNHKLKSIMIARSMAIKKFKKDFSDRPVEFEENKVEHEDIYSSWKFTIPYQEKVEGKDNTYKLQDTIIEVNRGETVLVWLVATAWLIFSTRLFTEYLLPFFVSVGTLIYYFWDSIGNLVMNFTLY